MKLGCKPIRQQYSQILWRCPGGHTALSVWDGLCSEKDIEATEQNVVTRAGQCLQQARAPKVMWSSPPLSGRGSSALVGTGMDALVHSRKHNPVDFGKQGKYKDMLGNIVPGKQQMGDFCSCKSEVSSSATLPQSVWYPKPFLPSLTDGFL